MKKNDWILITATLIYGFLFYDQYAGLNFLIFNIALISLLIYKNKELLRKKDFMIASIGSLLSSFYILYYSSDLAITANLFSLAYLSASILQPDLSFLTGITHTIFSTAGSFLFMITDGLERSKNKVAEKVKRPFYVYLLIILMVFFVGLIFFFLYRGANPLFKDFTKKLNFDFISVGWIFFTLGGFVLLYGFFYNRRMSFLSWLDDHVPAELTPQFAEANTFKINWLKTNTEFLSGIILLIILNFLLLIVNGLDLRYLWFDGTLPKGITLTEFVHDGVGALITSIILVIIILLFYFRGLLNFYQNNKWIKLLAYLWIVQNIFMIVSTALRNNMYISQSGLSYKKIGVYIYLLLTLIGLLVSFLKVRTNKSNWFLIRVNAFIFYCILVVSCTINWDVIITSFNLEKAKDPKKKLEKYYLADIGFKNIPQLLLLPDTMVMNDDFKQRDYYYSSRSVYFGSFQTAIHNKLFRFMQEMQYPDWRSFCIEKQRVLNDIMELEKNKKIDSLDLCDFEGQMGSLKPIESFHNLRILKMRNNSIFNISEMTSFPHLQKIEFVSCWIGGGSKFPELKELKELKLKDCNIKSIEFLKEMPQLEVLDLSLNNIEDLSPLCGLQALKKLYINKTSYEQMDLLKKSLPNTEIIESQN